MVASGCGGTGRELAPYADLDGLDLVTRSITLDQRAGGPTPRIAETPSTCGPPVSPTSPHSANVGIPWSISIFGSGGSKVQPNVSCMNFCWSKISIPTLGTQLLSLGSISIRNEIRCRKIGPSGTLRPLISAPACSNSPSPPCAWACCW